MVSASIAPSGMLHQLLMYLLLLHHDAHIGRVLLLSLLELYSIARREIHEGNVDTWRDNLPSLTSHNWNAIVCSDWSHVGRDVIVMVLVRKVGGSCCSMIESSCVISCYHV